MTDERARKPGRVGVRRELTLACGTAALVLVVVALAAVLASWQVARGQALKESERSTQRLADVVVTPLLQEALQGNRERADELERAIQNRMVDGDLTELTIWGRDGVIVYSDDLTQVGKVYKPPPEVALAIDNKMISSGFERHPEVDTTNGETADVQYVEVYVPYSLPNHPPMAFEAYYDYTRVENTARGLARGFIPLVLAPLLVLQFIQIPIAGSLARRVRRHESNNARFLENTLAASERERSRVAADLHDGPIQDIAGVSYALGAIAPAVSAERKPLMTEVQRTVQHAIESLRRLMVDLYPPDLDTARLPETLLSLTVPLREQGIEVTTEVGELPELSSTTVTTLYRVAREALANVGEHSQAEHLALTLAVAHGRPRSPVRVQLTITDDGVGVDPSKLDRRAEGHLGLRLLRDRVESTGGTFSMTGLEGGGTVLQVELPADAEVAPGLS